MKNIRICSLLSALLVVSGCVYTEVEVAPDERFYLKNQKNLTKIEMVEIGMTSQEVGAVMESQLKTGYRESGKMAGAYDIMAIRNPYKTETLTAGDGTYTVSYYYTRVKNPDGIVADDELTPLIFKDNKLVSKGWDALFKLKNSL